jgi:hypothetical protein
MTKYPTVAICHPDHKTGILVVLRGELDDTAYGVVVPSHDAVLPVDYDYRSTLKKHGMVFPDLHQFYANGLLVAPGVPELLCSLRNRVRLEIIDTSTDKPTV